MKHNGKINFVFNWIESWFAEASASLSPTKRGKKRARADYELDNVDEICDDLRPPSKMRRLPGQEESPVQNESFNFAGLSTKYCFKKVYFVLPKTRVRKAGHNAYKGNIISRKISILQTYSVLFFRYFSQQRWRKPIEQSDTERSDSQSHWWVMYKSFKLWKRKTL